MSVLKNLGIIVLLIGAAILIYLGFTGTRETNLYIGIGCGMVIVGFILHILLNKYIGRDC